MIERVIIFGAQTYFGICLCERLLEEGIEVKVVLFDREISETRALVEDRLLYIGRNALLEINDSYYRESEEDREADLVIYCGEEEHQDEFELLQDSINTANLLNSRFLYINSHHVHNGYQELVAILNEHSMLILPTIYGASLSSSNRINKALIQYLKNEKQEIVIEDHVLSIIDAVEATYNLLENLERKFYTFSMKKGLNPENSLPIRFVEDKENLKKKIKGICTIEVESSVSIEEGLLKQISYLKKNED
ncbi:nucleoside-diphosphate-sugar epimerase [Metabacillus crassostreae]|uniref:NAD(P)-dependent oxidoreductase n=1 Tax=Metabacillus crassostreae TaxID=929098 RepID=UPI001959EF14|nr:NAD(P)-dependent oxidoreductase [Metabacillus crassostreae]MBM7604093.1 nucleoside-diphosphate-sugar epimerase [Metabacillus crassostreae]